MMYDDMESYWEKYDSIESNTCRAVIEMVILQEPSIIIYHHTFDCRGSHMDAWPD